MLTTHDMEEAEALCERGVIIHRGRVVAHGSPTELKAEMGKDATMVDALVQLHRRRSR